MKKLFMVVLAVAITVAFGFNFNVAQADPPLVKLSGPHEQFNIIGHPKGVKPGGDNNGGVVFIPLKNATGPDSIVCEGQEVLPLNDEVPTFTDQEPAGAKIYWVRGDHFEILDSIAGDSDGATIMLDTTDNVLNYDVWVRVLGKPFTCMDLDAYATDTQNSIEYYFWAGSIDLNRQKGKATWTDVNYLFDVWWCQIDPVTELCVPGTEEELSVFDNVFESYFWNILNNGTRLVQVRLYPK